MTVTPQPEGTRTPDPLEATLPLLRALPAPALLYRPDGSIAGASPALEQLAGGPIAGMSGADLSALLQARFPTGRAHSFADLCRDLEEQPHPTVAVDLRDSEGLYRAMIASGAAVRSGGETVGVLIHFTEVTGLLRSNGAARR